MPPCFNEWHKAGVAPNGKRIYGLRRLWGHLFVVSPKFKSILEFWLKVSLSAIHDRVPIPGCPHKIR